MKISRAWLQNYFAQPLPDAQALGDALTFHAFEIESIEKLGNDDVLDVKVTPNRGHDCLSHRGIAKELSAILNIPMKADPLRMPLPELPQEIEMNVDASRAPVGACAYVRGVTIAPSPEWLKRALEAVGQRSINNVVDATNYVMFDIGMPTHAFDAMSFRSGSAVHYGIRASKKGEALTLLGGAELALSGDEAVIVNAKDEAVDIGGVKGGALAELGDKTTELLLSASKFEPVQTRKAAQRFNQRTEAAKRFENEMPDDLALYGIHAVAQLVRQVAGGEVVAYGVARSRTPSPRMVSVSLEKVNAVLGTAFGEADVEDVLKRLDLPHKQSGAVFEITVPPERLDIVIAGDLIEEVGRIVGYDKIPPTPLPAPQKKPTVNPNFYAAEKIREELMAKGYSEVLTSVFADKGERVVANKVDGVRPYLRANLTDGLAEALERNVRIKAVLGLQEVKLFEIGTVWKGGKEVVMVATAGEKEKPAEQPLQPVNGDSYDDLPVSATQRYQTFSKYPFIVRDIAMWIPESPNAFTDAVAVFAEYNRGLLRHVDLFDQFKKGERVSYAFHLVFQSFDKTLTDEEANAVMDDIYAAVKAKGWEVR